MSSYLTGSGCYCIKASRQEQELGNAGVVTTYSTTTALESSPVGVQIVVTGGAVTFSLGSIIEVDHGYLSLKQDESGASLHLVASGRQVRLLFDGKDPATTIKSRELINCNTKCAVAGILATVSIASEAVEVDGTLFGLAQVKCGSLFLNFYITAQSRTELDKALKLFPVGSHVRASGRILRLAKETLELDLIRQQHMPRRIINLPPGRGVSAAASGPPPPQHGGIGDPAEAHASRAKVEFRVPKAEPQAPGPGWQDA